MNKLIEKLAKLAKVSDVDAFAKALQSESDTDYELDTSNLIVNTKDELQTMKDNVYENAKSQTFKAASEIAIKNLKKEVGLDFEGKDPSVFIEKFKEQILSEAKIEPTKKITDLEQSVSNLQSIISEKESEFAKIISENQKAQRLSKVKSLIPDLPETLGLSKDEATSLILLGIESKEDGIYKNGELLKDEMERALTLDSYVEGYITDKGWNKTPKGRGGGSQSKGGNSIPQNLEEFETVLKERGYSPTSQEGVALLAEYAKENPALLDN